MTQPRCVLPGNAYFITRRCSERRFLLRPDGVVAQVFLFCLAVAARISGMEVHAYVLLSNHYHLLVTDVQGKLPVFMAWLNRHTGHCLKLHRKREGDFWESSEKYSAIHLETEEALWDKLAYLVANPAAANLVSSADKWPGLVSLPEQALGEGDAPKVIETERPKLYFRDKGPVEGKATLTLTIPPMLRDKYTHSQYIETWARLVAEREQLAKDLRGSRKPLGAKAVLRTSPFARPSKQERRRQRNPSLAAVTKEGLRKATKALKAFRDAHRAAYLQLRAQQQAASQQKKTSARRKPKLVFPQGTWWWVQHGGQQLASA